MNERIKQITPVGAFILKRMKEVGIKNRSRLADASHLSKSALYNIITEDTSMRRKTAEKLGAALKCDPDDILELTKPIEIVKREPPPEFPRSKNQLCWSCVNAVPDKHGHGCPWSMHFEPVPGWTAKKDNKSGNSTYHIKKCPLYEQDPGEEDETPKDPRLLPENRLRADTVFDKWCAEKGAW